MRDDPILTIAIPTFNRQLLLENTLASLMDFRDTADVEVLVVDNCSTDGTWEWLCRKRNDLGLTIRRNHVNLGIEGNIIQALLYAKGDYVWLLSDHMCIDVKEAKTFLSYLREGMEFTFGYARISQNFSVLPKTYTPFSIGKIDQCSLGELIFYVGNISAFVVNRTFLHECFRTIFRFSFFSYPHLGVFVHANESSSFIELPSVSSFIVDRGQPKRISYDTFRSRFIGFVRAVGEIRRLNPNFKNINKALNTRRLLGALVEDSISVLCFEKARPIKPSEFAFCLWHYPGMIKVFLLACLGLSALPHKLRIAFSKAFFRTLTPMRFKKAEKNSGCRFTKEIIIE